MFIFAGFIAFALGGFGTIEESSSSTVVSQSGSIADKVTNTEHPTGALLAGFSTGPSRACAMHTHSFRLRCKLGHYFWRTIVNYISGPTATTFVLEFPSLTCS